MKKITTLFFLFSIVGFSQTIQKLYSQKGISFRGLSALNDSVIWVSGSDGTVLRSGDGGESWKNISPAGYKAHDFRDIEALNDSTAVIMGIASPGVILETQDEGKTWTEIYCDNHPKVFMDAMFLVKDFWEEGNASIVIIGDMVKNQKPYVKIIDLLDSRINESFDEKILPELKEGEAFFAASGTNLYITNDLFPFVVSGGKESNLYYFNLEEDDKKPICKTNLPILQGKETTGANSIAFNEPTQTGMIVGGDFTQPDLVEGNAIIFKVKNNKIEFIQPNILPNGYRSCVDFVSDKSLISCGLNGVDISDDGGLNWKPISKESYHVCQKSQNGNNIFMTGANGKIGKLVEN